MAKNRKNRLPVEQSIVLTNFETRTEKQQDLVNTINTKEIILATGTSGVGKTYVTLATALSLLNRGYKKILLIKSVTSIPGEKIGYTPGDQLEKMAPYIMSYTWNIDKLIGKNASKNLIKKELIDVLPITYIRGLSIDDAVVIIDEAQNIDRHTFKSIITRLGKNSKFIFLGDVEQIDRRNKEESCLEDMMDIFRDKNYVGTVEFEDTDCVRNSLIPKVLEELRHYNI